MANLLNFAGKKAITRVNLDQADSPYAAMSLLIQDGLVGYIDSGTESGDIEFGAIPLPRTAIPVFAVTLLSYKAETLGTRVLEKVRRYSEIRDTQYVAVDLSGTGDDLAVLGYWRKQRDSGVVSYTGKGDALKIAGLPESRLNEMLTDAVKVMNANRVPKDQRKAEWDGVTTVYGHYIAQGQEDRAETKTRKAEIAKAAADAAAKAAATESSN